MTKRLSVALVAFACDPRAGSEPGNGWAWTQTLIDSGHRVSLITRPDARTTIDNHETTTANGTNLTVHYIEDRHWWFRYLPRRAVTYLRYLVFLRGARSHLQGDEVNHEIIHHVTWGSINFGSPFYGLGAPLIWGPIGGAQTTDSALRPGFNKGWRWEQFRNLLVRRVLPLSPATRASARRANCVLVTNMDTRDAAVGLGSRNAQVMLADAVAELHPSRRADPGGKTVLWVGRMLPNKGAALAVTAFAKLAEKDCEARLVMVGGGPDEPAVRSLVERLNLKRRVTLLGQVSRADVEKAYEEADVFLFSSLRDSFGAQILEAAAHGLPLVVLDCQSASSVLPLSAAQRVVTLPWDGIEQRISDALEEVLRDREMAASMSAASLEFAARNTWRARGEAITSIYREALLT